MIRVKVSIQNVPKNVRIDQFTGNNRNELAGCQFFVNSEIVDPDVWLVLEQPRPDDVIAFVRSSAVAYLATEPAIDVDYWMRSAVRETYLNQFHRVITFNPVNHQRADFDLPFLPWMINSNHGPSVYAPHARDVSFFRNSPLPPKSEQVSVICSDKAFTPMHKLRLRFVHEAKKYFGPNLAWFGNGVQSIDSKWDGLSRFRFTLAIENRSFQRVITEKLYDAYLAGCYPLYWGAPDAGQYFPEEAFTRLDIVDVNQGVRQIRNLLDSGLSTSANEALLQSRALTAGRFNLFSRLSEVAKQTASEASGTPQEICLNSPWYRPLNQRVLSRVGRRIVSIGKAMDSLQ